MLTDLSDLPGRFTKETIELTLGKDRVRRAVEECKSLSTSAVKKQLNSLQMRLRVIGWGLTPILETRDTHAMMEYKIIQSQIIDDIWICYAILYGDSERQSGAVSVETSGGESESDEAGGVKTLENFRLISCLPFFRVCMRFLVSSIQRLKRALW